MSGVPTPASASAREGGRHLGQEALELTALIPGGEPERDVTEARQFLEDLMAAVSVGMSEGKSLEELKRTIQLEKYKDWAAYQRLREDNIESAYNNLRIYR